MKRFKSPSLIIAIITILAVFWFVYSNMEEVKRESQASFGKILNDN